MIDLDEAISKYLIDDLTLHDAADESGLSVQNFRKMIKQFLLDDDRFIPVMREKARAVRLLAMDCAKEKMEMAPETVTLSEFMKVAEMAQKADRLDQGKATDIGAMSWLFRAGEEAGEDGIWPNNEKGEEIDEDRQSF